MLAFLPFLSLALFYRVGRLRGLGIRLAAMTAFGVFGVAVALGTELLSLFSAITPGGLLVFWGVVALISGVLGFKIKTVTKNQQGGEREPWTWTLLLAIAGMGVGFVILGLIAWSFAPNNIDSLVYHMARVAHWEQNGNVQHFATALPIQVYMSPLAEYMILHVQVLSGGDRFANFVQLFAAFGCVLGVSLIAKRLGADRRGQVLASVLCMTIPMGILQATSTQNDYVLALWLVMIACWAPLTRADAIDTRRAGWLGLILGLAVLTKGTAFVYAAPFVILFVVLAVLKLRRRCWPVLLIPTLTCLLIAFGHYFRNYVVFGAALHAHPGLGNEYLGLHPLVSNLVRNAALHFALPNEWFIHAVEGSVHGFHDLLGWDVNDPAMTFANIPFTLPQPHLWNHEDYAPNTIHIVLIGLAWLCAMTLKRVRTMKPLMIYGAVVTAGIVFFCALLQWQVWHSRLHLPFFVLMAPFVAVVFTALPLPRIVKVLTLGLLIYALPWVTYNKTRPLEMTPGNHDRSEDYFGQRRVWSKPFRDATDVIRNEGYTRLGLMMARRVWEYPLWILLHQEGDVSPRIEHVGVLNPTRLAMERSGEPEFVPDAILIYKVEGNDEVTGRLQSRVPSSYALKWEDSLFALYEKR